MNTHDSKTKKKKNIFETNALKQELTEPIAETIAKKEGTVTGKIEEKVMIGIRVPKSMRTALKILAVKKGVSMDNLCFKALEALLSVEGEYAE
jgi:hypothetical protein